MKIKTGGVFYHGGPLAGQRRAIACLNADPPQEYAEVIRVPGWDGYYGLRVYTLPADYVSEVAYEWVTERSISQIEKRIVALLESYAQQFYKGWNPRMIGHSDWNQIMEALNELRSMAGRAPL